MILNEEEFKMPKEKHFQLEILDPAKLIKVNNLHEVTNPIYFERPGQPTIDGLLSNSIFGITQFERSNNFAYIDLHGWFIHPLMYKIWSRLDKRIIEIVHGTNSFRIDSKGEFIEDKEHGHTGIDFLKKNIDNIKIKYSQASQEDAKFLTDNISKMFIKQFIIIPAYYRDVNTDKGRVGVGEINKLYNSLLIAVRALKETEDYGISMSDATRGRIQQLLLSIYAWFGTEPNIPGKTGIIRRTNLSKTSDFATRLVLSASNLKVETLEDMRVDLDHSLVPLASVCTNLLPFMVFAVRRFFENEFSGVSTYPYISKKGELKYTRVKDPLIEFSDERIKRELHRFVKGYSNRLIPIKVPNEDNLNIYMRFKGRTTATEDIETPGKNRMVSNIVGRKLTWMDVFFMAAVEVSRDKVAIITRYPMDTYFNQFHTFIEVNSTKETEPMYVDNRYYSHYPKIRDEMIGTNTSNLFIDSLIFSNLFLPSIGGDFDGDQCSLRISFTEESNEELRKHMNSKSRYITLGAECSKISSNEAIQSLYNLTLVLPDIKLINPIFK